MTDLKDSTICGGGGLGPRDVDAIAEELATSDGDESGAAIDGLGLDLGESGEERVNEV